MHDPSTVAHEIRLPWKNKHGYREPLLTIWHRDPETDGTDDSCGWFAPKISRGEREEIAELAKKHYPQLFARKVAIAEGQSWASVCYNQDVYGVIYWSWRAMKAIGKKGWQYGTERMSAKELEAVYHLATSPVDNFQSNIKTIQEERHFVEQFLLIYRVFKRFYRPWYKHPRWHLSHLSIQFHPWQQLKRRYWDKCAGCGKRGFKGSAMGEWSGKRIWHDECYPFYPKAPQTS